MFSSNQGAESWTKMTEIFVSFCEGGQIIRYAITFYRKNKSFMQKSISLLFLFAITAAGVVPCGGPRKSPCTASIVQILFFFWSFEISKGIQRNQNFIIGLESFSNQRLIYLDPF